MAKRPRQAPPQQPPDFDFEPQPFLGGHDPWRELQPEHQVMVERQLELYNHDREEVAAVVAHVFTSGRGPEVLELLNKMLKATPRGTYEEVLRRDGKADLLDWIAWQIEIATQG